MSGAGKMYLDMAKTCFRAGGMLEGTISFEIYRDLPYGCVVSLRLSGEETTEIQTKGKEKRMVPVAFEAPVETEVTVWKSNREDLTIIDRELVVFNNMGSNFPSGQYSFPFSFPLDEGLPSSFLYGPLDLKRGFKFGRIEYNLEARVKTQGSTEPILSVEMKEFGINQAVDERPIYSGTLTRAVNSFCCFSKGQVTFSVRLEKPVFYILVANYLMLEIDNSKCVVDVRNIRVTRAA